MNVKLHARSVRCYFELSLTVMNDEAHGVRLMLLCKTGKYSVMFYGTYLPVAFMNVL